MVQFPDKAQIAGPVFPHLDPEFEQHLAVQQFFNPFCDPFST
jgi:hypothetical protein